MEIIDAVGKSCPQPVILTKKALENLTEGTITVKVDNSISRDNVERFAKSKGCYVEIEEKEKIFYLKISKCPVCEIMHFEEETGGVKSGARDCGRVFYIACDQMGSGSEELGHILMRAFIKTIKDLENKPQKIIFVNSGVKLTTKGSKVIDDLKELENSGINIISCGTCLDYFGLKDELEVGRVSNMFEIASALSDADRIIRP